MPSPAFEIEVIKLTGDSIDEIKPEDALPPLPTNTISELSQALFELPPTMPWFSFGWLRDLVQGRESRSPPAATSPIERVNVAREHHLAVTPPTWSDVVARSEDQALTSHVGHDTAAQKFSTVVASSAQQTGVARELHPTVKTSAEGNGTTRHSGTAVRSRSEHIGIVRESYLTEESHNEHAGIMREPDPRTASSAASGAGSAPRDSAPPAKLTWIRDEWAPAVYSARDEGEEASELLVPLQRSGPSGWSAINRFRGRSWKKPTIVEEQRKRSPSVEFVSEKRIKPAVFRPAKADRSPLENAPMPIEGRRERSPSVEFVSESMIEVAGSPPAEVNKRLLGSAPTAPRYMLRQRPREIPRRLPSSDVEEKTPDCRDGVHSEIHKAAARATARFGEKIVHLQGSGKLIMYTDGSIRRGVGGAGVVYRDGNVWAGLALALDKMVSSTDAEMAAIFRAMALARTILKPDQRRLVLVTDSACAINWMADDCKKKGFIKHTITAALKAQKRFAEEGIAVEFRWVKGHASTEGNIMADKLAGFGADQAFKGLMHTFKFPDVAARFGAYVPEGPGRMKAGERRGRKLRTRLKMLQRRDSSRRFGPAMQGERG